MALRAIPPRRPVYIASYEGKLRSVDRQSTSPLPAAAEGEATEATQATEGVALRYAFPPEGTEVHGGQSDGYCFTVTFAAGKLANTYTMLREFLVEQGYGSVPVPADIEELRAFRLPSKLRHQLSLFEEDGYLHNPLKILFPGPGGKRGSLILKLYHERATGHLLRFHGRVK